MRHYSIYMIFLQYNNDSSSQGSWILRSACACKNKTRACSPMHCIFSSLYEKFQGCQAFGTVINKKKKETSIQNSFSFQLFCSPLRFAICITRYFMQVLTEGPSYLSSECNFNALFFLFVGAYLGNKYIGLVGLVGSIDCCFNFFRHITMTSFSKSERWSGIIASVLRSYGVAWFQWVPVSSFNEPKNFWFWLNGNYLFYLAC